jgi:hypothetical protein
MLLTNFVTAAMAVIKSAEHAALHTALHPTLDLGECAGWQRHDCGSEDPFAQPESSCVCEPSLYQSAAARIQPPDIADHSIV